MKKQKIEKNTGKKCAKPEKGRGTLLRLRAPKDSTLSTFRTTTIVRKNAGKSAHAYAITSGSTTAHHHCKCGIVRAHILLPSWLT